jgi:hypothetical protein
MKSAHYFSTSPSDYKFYVIKKVYINWLYQNRFRMEITYLKTSGNYESLLYYFTQ